MLGGTTSRARGARELGGVDNRAHWSVCGPRASAEELK